MSECEFVIPDANEDLSKFKHGSHVFLYARTSKIALSEYDSKALILMQLRFDGSFGFPGGVVDEGETPEEAVTRELVEETNYDVSKFGEIKKEHHLFTHLYRYGSFVSHFFAKEMFEADMKELFTSSTMAKEIGNENFGSVFVPLYTMKDGYRGFPAFLKNNFIGNAKVQLTNTIIKLNILTAAEVDKALITKRLVHTNLKDE